MYLGLVGSLINTVISIVWIPSPAKPKSEQRKTEDSKYLVILLNSTWIGQLECSDKGFGIVFMDRKVPLFAHSASSS